ncbi:hypothetical protein FRC12_008436 [Ceratobasidium sp. 428]|nr:hypothetical protein FRC12_008436 [Ceratobasidium sp. 428]
MSIPQFCKPDNGSDFCSMITANPDISGKGVRVAIYAQTFISMMVASWLPSEKAFRDTSRNSYVVSGSLIISSLIAWKRGELSLFDGLVTTMLTTIMTAFVTVNGPYIRTLGLSINLASLLFTTFWCYWGLQIWSDPWSFGLPADGVDCTANQQTIFVVFGHSVGATSRGLRGFAIFIFAIGAISVLSALWSTFSWTIKYLVGDPDIAKYNAAYSFAKQIKRKNRGKRATSSSRVEHITRYGGMVGLIYMIVTTEQIVQRNPGVSEDLDKWTYGQTIALILLLQQIMDCFSYFREWITEKHKRLEADRRRAARNVGP